MVMALHLSGIWVAGAFGKGKLQLLAFGMLQGVKEAKSTMVLMTHSNGMQFQIMSPKLDLKEKEGMVVPYFHIRPHQDPSVCNMEAFVQKVGDFQVPGYKNFKKVEPGDQLFYHKEPNEEEAPAEPKKAKRAA